MKKVLPPIFGIILLAVGVTIVVRPDLLPMSSAAVPTKSVVVRETSVDKPLSEAWVELFATAEKLGIPVWDKDVLGKGKKPSDQAKPFLDAAGDLPALVRLWSNGKYTSIPCPETIDALKKATGK